MHVDLRLPLGLLFTVIGLVLATAGLVSGDRSGDINVNLWWGIVLIVFGVSSLWMARARRSGAGGER